jgi:hypothetical protein
MTMLHEAQKAFANIPKEFRAGGNDLMYQLQEAAEAFDKYAGQVTQEMEQRREQEREEVLLACKEQDKLIEEIDLKISRAQDLAYRAESEMRGAEMVLRAARDSKPTRFPIRAEIAAWEASVASAIKGFDEAQEKVARKNGIVEGYRRELQEAKAKMQELQAKEFSKRPTQEQQDLTRRGMDPFSREFGLVGERIMGR